jgi:hypothetical protein
MLKDDRVKREMTHEWTTQFFSSISHFLIRTHTSEMDHVHLQKSIIKNIIIGTPPKKDISHVESCTSCNNSSKDMRHVFHLTYKGATGKLKSPSSVKHSWESVPLKIRRGHCPKNHEDQSKKPSPIISNMHNCSIVAHTLWRWIMHIFEEAIHERRSKACIIIGSPLQ